MNAALSVAKGEFLHRQKVNAKGFLFQAQLTTTGSSLLCKVKVVLLALPVVRERKALAQDQVSMIPIASTT